MSFYKNEPAEENSANNSYNSRYQSNNNCSFYCPFRNKCSDHFKNKDSATNTRQRWLILDLSARSDPVPADKLRHISPRIAEAYAGKTERTVRRDMNQLIEMELVVREKTGYRAKTETVRAFLPPQRSDAL